MYWGATRQPGDDRQFFAGTRRLRPGVPMVQARGWRDRVTVGELCLAIERCLDASPWAVVVDLTGLSGLQAGAVPKIVEVAGHARAACIGLHFVTTGGAVDQVLAGAPAGDHLVIHRSVHAAEQALGRRH